MTAKAELQVVIEAMSDEEAERLLDYINMRNDPDEPTPEDLAALARARGEFAGGDYVTLEQLEAELGL